MRIALVCRESLGAVDGIRDHTDRLADALRQDGVLVDLHLRRSDDRWVVAGAERAQLAAGLHDYDAVLLQYNPFLYGRRGFAPWLPADLWRLRASRDRPRIALLVHETAISLRQASVRRTSMSLWQHAQLRAVRAAADTVFVSIERWTRELGAMRPAHPTIHLPVGSNLPDRRETRDAARARLGVANRVVLATLSAGEATRRWELVRAAAARIAAAGAPPVLLALGSGGDDSTVPAAEADVHRPGVLPPNELASMLAAADIFLAPFDDGVSTRRGSLMAALQHGLPIVGTIGHLSDTLFRDRPDGLALVAPGDRGAFAGAAAALAADPDARRRAGAAASRLYEEHFDWPVLAGRILHELEGRP